MASRLNEDPLDADSLNAETRASSTEAHPDLGGDLETLLGPDPSRQATRRIVSRCYRIARAYLHQHRRTGALREDVLGEDVGDLAMDAIAGLFERNDQGRFPELRRYFRDASCGAFPPEDQDEHDLERALRRLVHSAVADWLFEAYRAADRSLSNQIRSLKRALGNREDAHLQRRGKAQWMEVTEEPSSAFQDLRPREPGRPMPLETLEAYLTGAVAEASSTGDLLEVAIETLRAHPDYEAAYPLTRLAQAMRAARTRVQAVTDYSAPTTDPDRPLLKEEEIRRYIKKSLSALRGEKRMTYVGEGKIDEDTYAAYFRALRDRLGARFVPPGDPEMTHYDALAEHLPGLEKEEYRDEHRSRFEYLERQARQVLVDRLQEVV